MLEAFKDQKAAEIMSMKFKEIERYMEAATTSAGKVRYNRFIHALNNFRFYTNTFDGDYQGSKNIIRDIISFAKRSSATPESLFDPKEVGRLTALARQLWGGSSSSPAWGNDLLQSLRALPTTTRSALGTMQNAVVYYYTAIAPEALVNDSGHAMDITKMSPGSIISLYEPKIGEALADLGMNYNLFLENPSAGNPAGDGSEMLKLWAATEKGGAQSSLNLWDDFHNMRMAFKSGLQGRQTPVPLTHHSVSDGNQSGIFLQAAIYGVEGNAPPSVLTMLSQAMPTLQDLRVSGWGMVIRELGTIANADGGDGSRAADWIAFFKEAADEYGLATVAKDFFKVPLMQAAYGKNAFMFESELYDVLASSKYAEFFDKHMGQHGQMVKLNEQLQQAVGNALGQIVNVRGNKNLMNIGQMFGVMNSPVTITGLSGDYLTISPTENAPVAGAPKRPRGTRTSKDANGKVIRLRDRNDGFETGLPMVDAETGAQEDVIRHEMQSTPSAKRKKTFLSRVTGLTRTDEDPFGYGLRRQLPVLLVQALDGDLVKWVTLKVNEQVGGMGPHPVMWVHDSAISTADAGLLYNHTYNNVAIPELMTTVQSMLPRLWRHKKAVKKMLVEKVMSRGEDVGIGLAGEHPALGAVFEELYRKLTDEKYKKLWFKPKTGKKNLNPNAKTDQNRWEEFHARGMDIIKEAEKNGWTNPDNLTLDQWQDLAVTPKEFVNLLELAEKVLNVHETAVDSHIPNWIARAKDRVKNAYERTMMANKHGGFVHMRISEASPANAVKVPEAPKRSQASVQEDKARKLAMSKAADAALSGFDDRPKTKDARQEIPDDKSFEQDIKEKMHKKKMDQIRSHLVQIRMLPNARDEKYDSTIEEILEEYPDKWDDATNSWENGITRTKIVEELKKRLGNTKAKREKETSWDDLDIPDFG
jgi:hypothetical protein